jgi:nucleoid-associated protein YgaU
LALDIGVKTVGRRKRFTLMPAIALAALGVMVAVPMLSSVQLYAATTQHYATVTVRPGDTLWGIAVAHAGQNADVQAIVDRIADVNHLQTGTLQPGQHLRIPE